MNVWNGGMIVRGGGETRVLRKRPVPGPPSTTNGTWTGLVSNPGFFSEGLVIASVMAWPMLCVIATGSLTL